MTSKDTLSSGELAERLTQAINALAHSAQSDGVIERSTALWVIAESRKAAAYLRGDSIGSSGGLDKDIGSSAALSPRSAKCAEAGNGSGPDFDVDAKAREIVAHSIFEAIPDDIDLVPGPDPEFRREAICNDMAQAAITALRFRGWRPADEDCVAPLTTEARYSGEGGKAADEQKDESANERRAGKSKLVYNKATRTIDTVRTDADEQKQSDKARIERLAAVAIDWHRVEGEYAAAQEIEEDDKRWPLLGKLTTQYAQLRKERDDLVSALTRGKP